MSDPYRPGQYPSPDQTTRIPPVRAHQPGPRAPEPPRGGNQNRTREYVLKGLGLLLVAVVSGMLYWLIRQGDNQPAANPDPTPTSTAQTKFKFVKHEQVSDPLMDSNCEKNSYRDVQKFFAKKPCVGLVRELYVTNVDGRKAYSSVAVVKMSNPQDAQELKQLTETDNTGNVNDLVRDGRVKVQGLRALSDGAFAAKLNGNNVVIVESDFEGGSKKQDQAKLKEISTEALQMGDQLSR